MAGYSGTPLVKKLGIKDGFRAALVGAPIGFQNELIEFLRIPSISNDPVYKDDMDKAARWLADKLRSMGINNVRYASHRPVAGRRRLGTARVSDAHPAHPA